MYSLREGHKLIRENGRFCSQPLDLLCVTALILVCSKHTGLSWESSMLIQSAVFIQTSVLTVVARFPLHERHWAVLMSKQELLQLGHLIS